MGQSFSLAKLVDVNNSKGTQKAGKLTHTASSVFWHEEPEGILVVPAPSANPPSSTRAQAALSSLEGSEPANHSLPFLTLLQPELDNEHLTGLLEREPRHRSPRASDPLWESVEEEFRTRMESTRPSLRLPMVRVLLVLVGQWEKSGDEKFLQGLNFNRLPLQGAATEDLLPSRTALIRSERTSRPALTNSPRFRPDPEELTAGRMDYEGMCEVLWGSTRAVEFECWRSGRSSQ